MRNLGTVMFIIGVILLICAGLVWPISIGTVIYHWAILDLTFKAAIGVGFFTWIKTFFLFIPGILLTVFGKAFQGH